MTALARSAAPEERGDLRYGVRLVAPRAHDLKVVAVECRADAGTVPLP